jgi:formylglycine-generating enzyme required for sulfatase activity
LDRLLNSSTPGFVKVSWLWVAVAALECNSATPAAPHASEHSVAPSAPPAAEAATGSAAPAAPAASAAPSGAPSAAVAAPASDAGADAALAIDVRDDMLLVPAGTFTMGADNEGEMDERPAHRVTLPAFLLDITPVTNDKYQECVAAGVCRPYNPLTSSRLMNNQSRVFHRPAHPVVGVSWFDAKTYCEWRGKRLPREAEWERAARGNDNRRYAWGDENPDPKRHGCFGGQATTQPVGSFPEGKGAFGHLDLTGNVWEWQADEYDPLAYQRPTADRGIAGTCEQIKAAQDELRRQGKQGYTGSNPIPVECERVLRGGAYNYPLKGLRNSNRVHHPPSWRIAVAGFRCAKDATPPSAH